MAGTEGQGVMDAKARDRAQLRVCLLLVRCEDSAFTLCQMGSPGTRGPGQGPTEQDSSRGRGQGTSRDTAKKRKSLNWGHLSHRVVKAEAPRRGQILDKSEGRFGITC